MGRRAGVAASPRTSLAAMLVVSCVRPDVRAWSCLALLEEAMMKALQQGKWKDGSLCLKHTATQQPQLSKGMHIYLHLL